MRFLKKSEGSIVVASHHSSASPQVAFFLPHLGGGGTEKMVVTLANGLASHGYAVDMVLVRAVGVYRHALFESIRVVDLNAISSYFSVFGLAVLYGGASASSAGRFPKCDQFTGIDCTLAIWFPHRGSQFGSRTQYLSSEISPGKRRWKRNSWHGSIRADKIISCLRESCCHGCGAVYGPGSSPDRCNL